MKIFVRVDNMVYTPQRQVVYGDEKEIVLVGVQVLAEPLKSGALLCFVER